MQEFRVEPGGNPKDSKIAIRSARTLLDPMVTEIHFNQKMIHTYGLPEDVSYIVVSEEGGESWTLLPGEILVYHSFFGGRVLKNIEAAKKVAMIGRHNVVSAARALSMSAEIYQSSSEMTVRELAALNQARFHIDKEIENFVTRAGFTKQLTSRN